MHQPHVDIWASFVIRLLLCSVPLYAAVTGVTAPLDSSQQKSLHQQGKDALAEGRLTEAEALLRSALSSLADPKTKEAVVILNEIGQTYQQRWKLNEAEKEYLHALELNRSLPDLSQIERASSLNNIGSVHLVRGELAEAEKMFRQSYAVLKENHLLPNFTSGVVLSNLAIVIEKQGRNSEAEPVFEEASSVLRQVKGEKSVEYSRLLTNWATASFNRARYLDALAKGKQAYAIQSASPAVSKYDLDSSLNNLGLTLFRLGRYAEAE